MNGDFFSSLVFATVAHSALYQLGSVLGEGRSPRKPSGRSAVSDNGETTKELQEVRLWGMEKAKNHHVRHGAEEGRIVTSALERAVSRVRLFLFSAPRSLPP